MIVLDSDFVVDFLNGVPTAVRQLDAWDSDGEELGTTAVNVAEIWRGAEASNAEVEDFLDTVVVLPLDVTAGRRAGKVMAHLDRVGRPLPELDALIAAIALEHGGRLATRNRRHFDRIPGLELVLP